MKNKQIIKKNKKQKGFTLIESLLAIAILMISVAAPMSLAYSGLIAAYLAEDQIVAYYLAQDAMEYVRNKRDYNKLENTTNMLDNIFNNCKVEDTVGSSPIGIDDTTGITNKGCNITTFGPINSAFDDKGVYNGEKLYYHDLGGEYNYDSTNGTLTKFSRQVRVGYINIGLTEVIVEVTIKWPNALGTEQEYKLRSHLTDW